MNRERRNPMPFGILAALFLVLISSLVGCENGTLGLKGGGISGTVVDSRTLAGVAGVSITAVTGTEGAKASKFATSDSNGNYYLSDLRADEWLLTFDKVGYLAIDDTASSSVKVVVVNNETSTVPQVRMIQTYENQYVTISANLKDATSGSLITYGNAQFLFGQTSFSNRLPTEFSTGFRIPASIGPISIVISVTGFLPITIPLDDARTDKNLGTIMLEPETYKIVGRWQDVPGWVFKDAPAANIFAYAGNRIVATAASSLNAQSFVIENIPKGTSVSITAEIKGYRMNGPVVVYPTGDFQGTLYQTFSLKNNFSQIMRDVRVIVHGTNINTNDYVGAYCEQTGTQWAQTIVTNPPGFTVGTPRVIDLGTNQMPTGYSFNFRGYVTGQGSIGEKAGVMIDDDGADAQIVTIQL